MLRAVARILSGSTYAVLGLDAVRTPGGRVGQAAPMLTTLRKSVPLPDNDELIVRGNAAVQVLAGTLLALGKAQRLSALILVGSLAPTTAAGHAFWAVEDPAARKLQRIQFHKNMAMIGGLLFAVLDQPLVSRGHHAAGCEGKGAGRLSRRQLLCELQPPLPPQQLV